MAYDRHANGLLEEQHCSVQQELLRAGGLGTVPHAVRKQDQVVVATREIYNPRITSQLVRQDRVLMTAFGAYDILQMLGNCEHGHPFHLVFRVCEDGDVADQLQQWGHSLQAEEAARWLQQVGAAVARLHAKPGNVLITGQCLEVWLTSVPLLSSQRTDVLPIRMAASTPAPDRNAWITLYITMHVGGHRFWDEACDQIDIRALAQASTASRFPTCDPEFGQMLEFPEVAAELARRMLRADTEAYTMAGMSLDSPYGPRLGHKWDLSDRKHDWKHADTKPEFWISESGNNVTLC
jgi:hypothetical protein